VSSLLQYIKYIKRLIQDVLLSVRLFKEPLAQF